ncbi:PD-(D/E)XK nuclease family protein [Maribacter halichondriae]|uniref:PD-(D/E)XK nuclease family protein n=1 Tax=Maribacter halichondriae TaxID=2980554 RepID=UPI00235893A6|nr:PD-(D/E)XK nuclease family protein [Maribacter sp. Hal144]
MQSFIAEIVDEVLKKEGSIEDLVFVLPSKRAGTFLRNAIAKKANRTLYVPEIYSIEDFVEKVSGLAYASNTKLVFELYQTYLKNTSGEKESFFSFSKWGQTLLQDFNEIDRHLVDPKAIFGNLAAVQEIGHWSLRTQKTEMMENYLRFWNNIESIYNGFLQSLTTQGLGYQGLVYKKACANLETYQTNYGNKHIFIGFNALNAAESQLIQKMLASSKAEIYWDIDSYFLTDPIHDAGYFIREYQKKWPYLRANPLQGVSNHYEKEKDIQIVGVPKNISQAKYVGHLLKNLCDTDNEVLSNAALVLGDENLLNPILNSIPEEIETVNITMGYPLQKTILAGLFDQFFNLYINVGQQGWYHRNVLEFLSHPYVHKILDDSQENFSDQISTAIKKNNITYLNARKINSIAQEEHPYVKLLFFDKEFTTKDFIKKCLCLIQVLKTKFSDSTSDLELGHLYRFYKIFNQISDLLEDYDFITDIKSLHSLYSEILASETLDFQGDPLEGLQIMGMLESRNLDFETVIITSVNEGILPSGKSNNSFIPFDLKTYFGLPTYKEKDAVYTYHFYRLLQRAKNIYILYNTEPDALEGGEKSRLITQMLTDERISKNIHEKIAAPEIRPITKNLAVVFKDTHALGLIEKHASNGFSPSSLSSYIRNPIDFYKQSLLGIEDTLTVEETVAANTFGTIVHNTLEDLYTPLIGERLSKENLMPLKLKIKGLVKHHFVKSYFEGDPTKGKNLIAYHVIVRYLENFIDMEIEEAQNHNIKIIGLEEKLKLRLDIPEIGFPTYLKGKLDRIDEKDGILRIIDYKTGKVEPKNVTVSDWEDLIMDYEYSKAFQLLCYTFMYQSENNTDKTQAGIITFKNLYGGFQKLTLRNLNGKKGKYHLIEPETLLQFQGVLKNLVLEICDIDIPFTEKEV